MELVLTRSVVRSWRTTDAESLARHANNRKIWLNLKDRFPHPYTREDAEGWITFCQLEEPESNFAIEVEGAAVGSVGFEHRGDIWRKSVELGYWLGEGYWGHGIVSEVVPAITAWAFGVWDIERVWAGVFAENAASLRVLEKAGFVCEGRLRRSAVKEARMVDEVVWGRVR